MGRSPTPFYRLRHRGRYSRNTWAALSDLGVPARIRKPAANGANISYFGRNFPEKRYRGRRRPRLLVPSRRLSSYNTVIYIVLRP